MGNISIALAKQTLFEMLARDVRVLPEPPAKDIHLRQRDVHLSHFETQTN
jgi:hypothetical protein